MKRITLAIASLFFALLLHAGGKDSTTAAEKEKIAELNALYKTLDSAETTTHYQTGAIALSNNVAHINLPAGFKFIDGKQSQYILQNLWHNLPDPNILGMIVKDSFHLNSFDPAWVFTITYDDMGYVKDDDADKVNYQELLTDLKKSQEEANTERKKLGYSAMHLTGWAASPFYDKQNNVLHWAKEYSVDGDEEHTLNYEVRVLGRKGVLSLTAIATVDQLEEVKKNIPAVLKMAQYDKGYKYEEFDSGIDKVAAWTIGGLVAGKLLAKAGLLVVILKFWKLIALAVAGGFAAFKRFFTGKKKEDEIAVEQPAIEDTHPPVV